VIKQAGIKICAVKQTLYFVLAAHERPAFCGGAKPKVRNFMLIFNAISIAGQGRFAVEAGLSFGHLRSQHG
jgi:hypothetical protein